ncbi:oxidoreductase [Luminiphilus syltensis NOR5-1B]|uniref:Oxidoreductase n=1 Tax=Luminiphilus syltensis NOR5-1B TaxID=565045 RepID=B8KTJ3_9GAMM|nr:nitroreductase [Luminiphilus syltensis]EED35973.1 oxidoreductase [Luminiphilus syltensis NOR5-1B]
MGKQYFEDVVQSRHCVRAFKKQAVPLEVLREALALAGKAPSNYNIQPWHVVLCEGDACEDLRQAVSEAGARADFTLDFPFEGDYSGVYEARQADHLQKLQECFGIDRLDDEGRNEIYMRNFRFFDAPNVALFFIDPKYSLREAIDVGMFAQTFMLALESLGVGSCPQTALGFHSQLIREKTGVGDNLKLLFGMSIGYSDEESSAYDINMGRAEIDDFCTFLK